MGNVHVRESGYVVVNGVRYEGPHKAEYGCGLACGIVMMVFGILLTVASIALIVVGALVAKIQVMWIIGCATLVLFIILLVTGVMVMRLYCKKITQNMTPSNSFPHYDTRYQCRGVPHSPHQHKHSTGAPSAIHI